MPIDWARPFVTTEDRPARQVADDLGGPFPYAVAVELPNGSERVFRVDAEGVCPDNPAVNLHNLFLDEVVFVNVYNHPSLGLVSDKSYTTEAEAVANVRDARRLIGRNQVTLRAVFD